MKISETHAPKPALGKKGIPRDAFRLAVETLDVGVAITLTKDEDEPMNNFRSNIVSRVNHYARVAQPARKYQINTMGPNEVQIHRVS